MNAMSADVSRAGSSGRAATDPGVNTLLRHKVMFGSDYPLITPERWISDFDALPLKDGVRDLVLKDNAIRVLGLGG